MMMKTTFMSAKLKQSNTTNISLVFLGLSILNLQFAYKGCTTADILLNSLTPAEFLKKCIFGHFGHF